MRKEEFQKELAIAFVSKGFIPANVVCKVSIERLLKELEDKKIDPKVFVENLEYNERDSSFASMGVVYGAVKPVPSEALCNPVNLETADKYVDFY